MSGLYYSFELNDSVVKEVLSNEQVTFDERKSITRNVNSGDSTVTVDLTELGTIGALHIKTSGSITVTLNGQALAVNSFLFVTLDDLTSLTLACSDTDGYEVTVTLWSAA